MTSGRPPVPASTLTIWIALVTVYLVWGSTYLAIRVVVDTAPPLLAMGARFLAAGLLLATFLLLRRGPRALAVSRRQLGGAALVGLLLLLCGNGGVAVAEQTVPSGVAALLVAATPLWLVVLRRAVGDRVARLTLVGTALGFVGIAVLVLPGGLADEDGTAVESWGLVVVIVAAACWAVGSFVSSRIPMPERRVRRHHLGDAGRRRRSGAVRRWAPASCSGFDARSRCRGRPGPGWRTSW